MSENQKIVDRYLLAADCWYKYRWRCRKNIRSGDCDNCRYVKMCELYDKLEGSPFLNMSKDSLKAVDVIYKKLYGLAEAMGKRE